MTGKLEVMVTPNDEQSLYVIDHGDYITTYGYDRVLNEIDRISTELSGRGILPEKFIENTPGATRGSKLAWDLLQSMRDVLKRNVEDTGDKAIYNLTPQLTGLEGWRVEVVDHEGDKPRRFIVGKSTGWAPCHLEISRRTAHGGGSARSDYYSVTQVERVR